VGRLDPGGAVRFRAGRGPDGVGISPSKAYKIIDRFSEDIDLTHDIRKLIPELVGSESSLPTNRRPANGRRPCAIAAAAAWPRSETAV